MRGHRVGGCTRFNGAHVTDRFRRDGRAVLGIDSPEDHYPRTIAKGEPLLARHNTVLKEPRDA